MGEAKEITKIIIKGSSGYCAYSEAYKDRLTIEKEKISYEYLPEEETKINPVRKWNYTTNSPLYQTLYERIAGVSLQGSYGTGYGHRWYRDYGYLFR